MQTNTFSPVGCCSRDLGEWGEVESGEMGGLRPCWSMPFSLEAASHRLRAVVLPEKGVMLYQGGGGGRMPSLLWFGTAECYEGISILLLTFLQMVHPFTYCSQCNCPPVSHWICHQWEEPVSHLECLPGPCFYSQAEERGVCFRKHPGWWATTSGSRLVSTSRDQRSGYSTTAHHI